MPESSETPARRAQRWQQQPFDDVLIDGLLRNVKVVFARDVIALEAVARRLLDGWRVDEAYGNEVWHRVVYPGSNYNLPAEGDDEYAPLSPEEARILDLLRERPDVR